MEPLKKLIILLGGDGGALPKESIRFQGGEGGVHKMITVDYEGQGKLGQH